MTKMSKSEAGKLGAAASKTKIRELKNQRIAEYNKDPNLCHNPVCNKPISYEKRQNKFCSHSCAATFNNTKYPKRGPGIYADKRTCQICSKSLDSSQRNCCSRKCAGIYKMTQKAEEGKASKRYIIKTQGYECAECSISEWKDNPLSLQLDHIDGNPDNNNEDNLRLLCPNCHSQTETYTNKRGSKKKKTDSRNIKRRIRYYQSQGQDSNLREAV